MHINFQYNYFNCRNKEIVASIKAQIETIKDKIATIFLEIQLERLTEI